MELAKHSFLTLMSASLGRTVSSYTVCSEVAWEEVFILAEQHHVLPMIVDAAYRIYGNDIPRDCLTLYKKRAQQLTYIQTVKTERFLTIYRFLSEQGLIPLVIKGLICRELYPEPDFRFSADEDFLIPPDKAMAYHRALLAYGLKTDASEKFVESGQEISYTSKDGSILLEVHRSLFPEDSGAYGQYNEYFADAFERTASVSVAGVDIQTMAPTDHLFYLICHTIKHFMHGGCGIRQVCDIALFANVYAELIDWTRLTGQIDSIQAKDFTAGLFTIAERSLGIDTSGIPEELHSSETSPEALLDDILDSGVYGASTMSRKHSATITLRAAESVRDARNCKKSSRTRTLFPPASTLKKTYPYLANRPWLLPIAWGQRICRYIGARGPSNKPGEALRIGRERVDLMKKYGLLSAPSAKLVDTGEYLSALCELVDQGHEVCIPVTGSSMSPFLGDGRDQVFVKAPEQLIRRGDIVLYRRNDGNYVLHRVHSCHGKGDGATYDMIGDAQNRIEHDVQRQQIFAVAIRARRKGKLIEPGCPCWWFFQHIWIRLIPLRYMLMRLYAVKYRLKF